MIAFFGESDPITDGGGRVFDTSNGPFLEYTLGTDTDGRTLELYRTHIGDDLCKQFDGLLDEGGLEEMCECMSVRPEAWRRAARGRLSLRAQCIVDLANHFGWDVIDDDPLEISEVELQLRWFSEFNLEGPVTTAGCSDTAAIVPELLIALRELDTPAHDALFSRRFPLVPSSALQNRESQWWKDVGPSVEETLVEILSSKCPGRYVFKFDPMAQQYGFWPIARS